MKEIKSTVTTTIKRTLGENIYSKISNDKRMALLDMVKTNGKSLKDAANILQINYSTAKTILRVFRIENRILKKSPINKKPKKIFNVESDSFSNTTKTIFKTTHSDERKESISPVTNTVKNTSGNNFFSEVKDKVTNSEKLDQEFSCQLKFISESLRVCIDQVIKNDIVIMHILNFIDKIKLPCNISPADFNENVIKPIPIPIHINNYMNLGRKLTGGNSSKCE
jgi:hypothetical protein